MRTPVAATMPNITSAAPPSTYCGIEAAKKASLGRQPSTMRMPPAVAQTQRLRTPVTCTSPTFCAYEV
ncbi:hypothetical protein D3C86_2119250 [compost metagenome]